MNKDYFISVYLDTRRALKDKKYPVKIRVFTPSPRRQKLYPTKFEFTAEEFESIWLTVKTRQGNKLKKREIQSVLDKAEDVAKKLHPFTIEQFEKEFYQKTGESENVFFQYDKVVSKYRSNDQLGTASNYELSLKSLKDFLKDLTQKESKTLLFREISPTWLSKYENYMIKSGRNMTTVGIYLRPLRALFRTAILQNVIPQDIYPFGKGRFEIPQPRAVRKALTNEQLRKLLNAVPVTAGQQKAKDFWFFLFNTSGMNVKDLARLRYRNLNNDTLVYVREKTKRTTKARQTPVVVYLNEYAKEIIEKYGNPDKQAQNYIFNIFNEGMTEEEKFKRAGTFTTFLNENIKKLAKANGLPDEISTYWSRHSFATSAIRSGASMEQIRQALNHHNLSTTEGYFAGFEDDTMKRMANNLMNF